MTDTSKREELIEEAAKAIHGVAMQEYPAMEEWRFGWMQQKDHDRNAYLREAEAALAVFEQAHTPTDDERADALRVDPEVQRFADRLFEVGLRSPESTKALLVFKEFRRTVQGEPTDEQVLAARRAYNDAPKYRGMDLTGPMRAALRAAGGVR